MGPAVVTFAVLVVAFAAFAHHLGRWNITAPIVFVVAGAVLGLTIEPPRATEVLWVKVVAEITLALVLFHDAAQVRPRDIASERNLAGRLLLVGFPLTILGGFLLARALFPDQPVMLSLMVAAALAATDAGLGAPTVLNPVVPIRIRRTLNIESGLNDGLATPIALFAIAALAGSEGLSPGHGLAAAAGELILGILVGALVGAAAAVLLGWSRSHDWSTSETRALGIVAVPVIAYGGAELVHGNGFVAAFIAGTALTGAGRWLAEEHSALHLTEILSGPLGFAVWGAFGLVAVPRIGEFVGWREVAYALLSLTVLRMLPVALSLLGTGLRAPTVLFLGWFGPRGLVSVVFALIAVETLHVDDSLRATLSIITLTVTLSVLAHGISADPLARRYGRWVSSARPSAETSTADTGTFTPQPRGSIMHGAEPPD